MRRHVAHLLRCGLFAAIFVVIHLQHERVQLAQQTGASQSLTLAQAQRLFPTAAAIASETPSGTPVEIVDSQGQILGQIVQTSPVADHIVGYCGPTNVLIAVGRDSRIAGIELLESHDTRDHVAKVRADQEFVHSFDQRTGAEVAGRNEIDTVSGATLTSLAIHESIALRLTGATRSLRFPEAIPIEEIRAFFPTAQRIAQGELHASWWHVWDGDDHPIGSILRTAPAADSVIGYQGPSDAWVGFDSKGQVLGVQVGRSYDNEPYVTYVRDDTYFKRTFNHQDLTRLANFDLQAAQVEGVSGATMTSMAVAEGIVQAAAAVEAARKAQAEASWRNSISRRDLATWGVILAGLVVGLTRLRGNRWAQRGIQLLVVGYLGIATGDMLSLALIGGWAQHGVAWRHGLGLVALALAAFVVPLTSRTNIYCSHLCPHGIVQQWAHRISPWHIRLPHRLASGLAALPLLLLAVAIWLSMRPSALDLVDLEAFDAWHLGIAGGAALTIAVVGLAASLVSPMAYCRYGCPTGAILRAARYNSRSGEFSRRDGATVGLLTLACVLYWA